MRSSLIFLILMALSNQCFAFECIPGKEERITACDQLSVSAQWNESNSEDCTYNPPPGWIIVDHYVSIISESNGSQSVSTLAGGSNFATERDVNRAYDYAQKLSSKYTDNNGQQRESSVNIIAKKNTHIAEMRHFSATNNTIYATVSASGSGDFFSRQRGWMTITVFARLRCMGDPDPNKLLKDVLSENGINSRDALIVRNSCKYPILFAIFDEANKQHYFWYSFEPGTFDTLDNMKGDVVRLTSGKVYFFARVDVPVEGSSKPSARFWSSLDGPEIKSEMEDVAFGTNFNYTKTYLRMVSGGFYELNLGDKTCQ